MIKSFVIKVGIGLYFGAKATEVQGLPVTTRYLPLRVEQVQPGLTDQLILQ